MSIEDIYLFFLSPTWENIVSLLKPVCLMAIFIFLLAILWALTKSKWLFWYVIWDSQDFFRGEPAPFSKKTQETWKRIKKKLLSKEEADWRSAVIEGGDIAKEVLSKMGYKGRTIKEKLETATKAQIPNIEKLAIAGEVYKNTVSNPAYKVTKEQTRETFNAFEQFLKYFEYL